VTATVTKNVGPTTSLYSHWQLIEFLSACIRARGDGHFERILW